MALPIINTPTYELEVPSTDEKIKYRPFLVKEEKILMMAMESKSSADITQAVKDIVNECTFNKVNISNMPMFDVEYIFLKIRGKSVGDIVELNLICPDDGVTQVFTKIDLNEVEVQISEDHKSEIQITDQIKLVMTYPTLSIASEQGFSTESIDSVFNLLQTCIKEIHSGDEVFHKIDMKTEEITEFVESLNTEQFNSVIAYFDTMPKLREIIKVKNPKTKVESEVTVEGIDNFF